MKGDTTVSGSVADRPWGQTLGALGERGLTGQLTLVADDKSYGIAFDLGSVVGATSPVVADALVRIALTSHLVTSTQVAEISRRIAAAPERDEVELLAEAARFSPEQVLQLRRRAVVLRAARTFAIDQGEFAVEQRIAMPIIAGNELDVRAVVYLGARMHLSEQRLADDLRHFGAYFVLKQGAHEMLPQFGFTDAERPILDALSAGTSLPQLEASHRDIDPRTAQAVVYALACCGACEIERVAAPRTTTSSTPPPRGNDDLQLPRTRTEPVVGSYGPFVSRTATGPHDPAQVIPIETARAPAISRTASSSTPAVSRTISGPRVSTTPGTTAPPRPTGTGAPPAPRTTTGTGFPAAPRTITGTSGPAAPRTTTGTSPPTIARTPTGPTIARTPTGPTIARTPTGPTIARTSTARRVQAMITARMSLLEQGADHFALLGVPFDAPIDAVRSGYLNVVRQLHPEKLAELAIHDEEGNAQRLLARISAAFAVLTDPHRRASYLQQLELGVFPSPQRVKTEDRINKAEAAEAFKRGQLELRRDQPQEAVVELSIACDLDPHNIDYQTIRAWAVFCAAPDKTRLGVETRKVLERSVLKSDRPEIARFYLGRVERMLGRDREALHHFREVLETQPNHADAASEIRAIEARVRNTKR